MTYDLNSISLTLRIHQTWRAYLKTACEQILKKYPDLQAHEIPDEMFRCNGEGTPGQLFVTVRNIEIKLNVPAKERAFNS